MAREKSYATLDDTGNVPLDQLANSGLGGPHNHAGEDITSGTVADARVASTVARDSEVTTAVTTHEGAADPHTGYVREADANWVDLTDGGASTLHSHAASGAPADADYLVGTAHAGLSAEIVVGATPGGELGNTWASPTVDATHSGSTHAATQAAAESTAAAALSGHEADTTAIHGIADTSALSLTSHDHDADYEATGAVATHAGLADPHTGYRLESADHSHATTGLQGGTVAHTALTSVSIDDHHARDHAINAAVHTGTLDDAQIPAGITRDAEAAAAYAAIGHSHSGASTLYAPGSFTVADGNFALMTKRLILTTSERVTLEGTARLRID